MLIELQPSQFERVRPLLADHPQTVIPYAVCEGINPGRIFADALQDPQTALIWTTAGYFCLCGAPSSDPDTLQAVSDCLIDRMIPASQERGERGFVFITSPGWENYLPRLLPGRSLDHIFRRPFALNPNTFHSLTMVQPPPSCQLVRMDGELALKAGLLASWKTPQAFAQHAIGYALLHQGEIAAFCASVFVSKNAVEIDVQTSEPYRRQGLAILTATAFVSECLRQGKRPNWECFWDNRGSAALAARLGFLPLRDYPVTYWEEPGA